MPYKYDDRWHSRARKFIEDKVRCGRLYPDAAGQYRRWLHLAWTRLNEPDPETVTLSQLEELEGNWDLDENTLAIRCRVVRDFLRFCKNPAAQHWEIRSRTHPKEDRLFLSEEAVKDLRPLAQELGPDVELIYSLGVDNSLRCGDIARITFQEAKELLWKGQAMITCKGRRGGKRRLLIMSNATREPLRKWLIKRDAMVQRFGTDPGGLMLTVNRKELHNMSPKCVARRVTKLGKKAGIDLRSHDLRATFGNRHWKAKTDLLTIAALMGHETPDQTFRAYIGVRQGDMRDAQDKLSGG